MAADPFPLTNGVLPDRWLPLVVAAPGGALALCVSDGKRSATRPLVLDGAFIRAKWIELAASAWALSTQPSEEVEFIAPMTPEEEARRDAFEADERTRGGR